MRIFLILVSLISIKAYPCGQQIENGFLAFATQTQTKDSYMVYFPDNDFSQSPMYLSGITAFQADTFSFELEFFKSDSHTGYYQTLVSASQELLANISIGASYSYTNEAKSSFALCANWKIFTLKQLLAHGAENV